MSLKLYFLERLGVIKRTKQIDLLNDRVWEYFKQFQELKKSDEFNRFLELEKEVNSEEFAKKKVGIMSLRYKGSKEQLKQIECAKLIANGNLASFYRVVDSNEFKRFKELDSSYLIKEFKLAKAYAETEFEADKQNFDAQNKDGKLIWEKSKPYQKFRMYEETLHTDDVQFWLTFSKSKEYGIYKEKVNQPERAQVEVLKREIESEEFKLQQAFLENSNRWETTPAYARLQEYEKLCSDAQYVDYLAYRDNAYFCYLAQHELLLQDDFKGSSLDEDSWCHMSSYAVKHTGFPFSHETDLQGYTLGRNVKIDHETLCINTEKESVRSFAWKSKIGFIPYEYNYSSGSISHKQVINAKQGALEAKVKFYSAKRMVDLIYLANADYTFRLNLLEMGSCTQVSCQKNAEKVYQSLEGLRKGKYYIFRVEWGEHQITWWVNNYKLLEVKLDFPEEDLFLNIRSIVVNNRPKTPHKLQIDWIRVFSK
ncbi:MAG: hypothetical protein ACK5MI_01510 [Mangrovibacterium sp.]